MLLFANTKLDEEPNSLYNEKTNYYSWPSIANAFQTFNPHVIGPTGALEHWPEAVSHVEPKSHETCDVDYNIVPLWECQLNE